MVVLGIETSCDETAAAIYNSKRGILSNELFSQIELHRPFGGVVPEIASRSHLEKINVVVQQALDKAGVTLDDIDVIAVTNKPGLPGSLLIGVCFAKALAWVKNKKIIGVNHLEGHAFSAFLEHAVPFPHICITASGGHTSLYMVHGFGEYEVLGQTTDDAAGEAFDKIAKIMELTYPGGPVIERLAQEVNFKDFRTYPRQNPRIFDFSYSGLKTAVLYDLVKHKAFDMATKKLLPAATQQLKQEVASSLLVCIADGFEQKIALALEKFPHIKALSFVGGVACNKYIKQRLLHFCQQRGIEFYSPSPQFCTDNAAMIAFVGNYKAEQGKYSDFSLDILA